MNPQYQWMIHLQKFGKEHLRRVRGVKFGPSLSSMFGLPTQQLQGVSLESNRGGLSQSQMGERV